MEIRLSDEQRRFRDEVRAYFARMMTDELRRELAVPEWQEGGGPEFRNAMRQMGRDGLLGLSWPKEYGGQERTPIEQFIFADEIQATGFPLPFLTLNTVGPVLFQHGSEQQRREICTKILAGELFISIGYSEPDAGTDLASLKTTARRDGDDWLINGQKMWTSLAQYADYVWLAARTDAAAPKHRGLSMFLVPTTVQGFARQEIRTVGGVRTNATFYDDVRVPAGNLIGKENGGWKLITGQLNHERISLRTVGRLQRLLEDVTAWARERDGAGRRVVDEAWVQHNLARARQGLGAAPDELAAGVGGDEGAAEHGRLVGDQGLRQRGEHRVQPAPHGGAGRARHLRRPRDQRAPEGARVGWSDARREALASARGREPARRRGSRAARRIRARLHRARPAAAGGRPRGGEGSRVPGARAGRVAARALRQRGAQGGAAARHRERRAHRHRGGRGVRVERPARTGDAGGARRRRPPADRRQDKCAGGDALDAQETSDGQPHAQLTLDGVHVPAASRLETGGDGTEALRWIVERALVARCMMQLGVTERALEMTAQYGRDRVQFDRPIGSFQAVHQRAADAYINVAAIRLTAWEAAWRLSRELPASAHVAVAKFWAAEGGQFASYACQHLHGGIGIDTDYPLHRYFRWAIQIEHELGSAKHHLERLGRQIAEQGLPAA